MKKLLRVIALVLVFALAFPIAALAGNPNANPGVSSITIDGVRVSVSGTGANLRFDVVIISTGHRVDVVRAGTGTFWQNIYLPDGRIISVRVHGNSLVAGSETITPAPTPTPTLPPIPPTTTTPAVKTEYRITMTMPHGYPPFVPAKQSSLGFIRVNLGDKIPWDEVYARFQNFSHRDAPLAREVKPENLRGWTVHPGATRRPGQHAYIFENYPMPDIVLTDDMFIHGVGNNADKAELNLYPIFGALRK
ncbi:MAG: hypothetical protein LBE35_05885 [Clostridiales bacterium]|nr:hypothetical protein [Clostridiales bacterium]